MTLGIQQQGEAEARYHGNDTVDVTPISSSQDTFSPSPEALVRTPVSSSSSQKTLTHTSDPSTKSQDTLVGTPDTSISSQAALEKEAPYHVCSSWEKRSIVYLIGIAGLFSGLSSNIYFPVLDEIAEEFHVAPAKVNLSITTYLVLQGVAPLVWGSLSDTLGRRVIYLASFAVYIGANAGLSVTPSFGFLLAFRALQAAGSAATVSIGTGVIQDIATSAERGGHMSFHQLIRNFSMVIGPVIGGALADKCGFRSIFVFLLIFASVIVVVIFIFLPETLRTIAGNGSLRLKGIHQPLIRCMKKEPAYMNDRDETYAPKKVTGRTFFEPLLMLREVDVFLNLFFGGVIYAIWSMTTSSMTSIFSTTLHLTELQVGLAFLPNGFGTIVGSVITGKLMDRNYRAAEKQHKIANNIDPSASFPRHAIPHTFPIERARLKHTRWIATLYLAAVALYGFSLSFPSLTSRTGWIAVPLTLQFFIAATSNAVFVMNSTLMTDLFPGQGASSTAVSNLVRCSMGAGGVAVMEKLIEKIGVQWTFLVLAGVGAGSLPVLAAQWVCGQRFRGRRAAREEKKKKQRVEILEVLEIAETAQTSELRAVRWKRVSQGQGRVDLDGYGMADEERGLPGSGAAGKGDVDWYRMLGEGNI